MESQENKPIQLFVPTFDIEQCLSQLRECLEIGWTGLGFKTVQFENAWKEYTGLSNAHFLASNTVGLHLAIKIFKQELNWKDGDEIISTPLTFVSTNHAIRYENLNPVFADVDDTLCLDPKSIEKKISSRTRAVMFVGFGGSVGQLKEVSELCRKHNLKLILDAAHMAGTKYFGKHVGNESDVAIFSYQAVKNLPCGDAGMICFRDQKYDAIARKMSWLGISLDTFARSGGQGNARYKWLYDVEYVGLKAHGNSLMAGICLAQLKHLDNDNERRRLISDAYTQRLSQHPKIKLIKTVENCQSSRHLFQIRVPQNCRNELITHLNSRAIYPGVHYRSNTDYSIYEYGKGTCPNAELLASEIISLPLHLRLADEDVERVCSEIISFFDSLNS